MFCQYRLVAFIFLVNWYYCTCFNFWFCGFCPSDNTFCGTVRQNCVNFTTNLINDIIFFLSLILGKWSQFCMYHRTRASSVHYPIAKKTKVITKFLSLLMCCCLLFTLSRSSALESFLFSCSVWSSFRSTLFFSLFLTILFPVCLFFVTLSRSLDLDVVLL